MKKHRVSTTISEKHWELLKNHKEKYETHQRVLEAALESLERIESMKNSSKSIPEKLTPEEECWRGAYTMKSLCILTKDSVQMLMKTADVELNKEYIIRTNTIAYAIECYLQKPIIECSLKEVVSALIIILKTGNCCDSVDCMENDIYYTIILTHILGLNGSKIFSMSYEYIFKSCGFKTESVISEKTIFLKIYKNK